ncbi:MAG: hypothetical protein IPP60_08625 [Sphingobacteriales bacterium]|jgi:uncharacterized protein YneF (UPF0154 family)|nr:hypothetical protein [Sphingobacteriales bacterium]
MKNIKLSEFEIYILKESLIHYKETLEKQEFPKNSIVTKEYVKMTIKQVEEKFNEKAIKQRMRELNAK